MRFLNPFNYIMADWDYEPKKKPPEEPPPVVYTKLAAALNAEYSGLNFRAERHESRPRVCFTIEDPIEGLLAFDSLRCVAGWYGVTRIVCEIPDPETSWDEIEKNRVFCLEGCIDVVDFERSTRKSHVESYNT